MTIRFVSSVTFTESYLPSHQTRGEFSDGGGGGSNSRWSFPPVGVSVVNIALESALEIEATWPRPEELGSGPGGKSTIPREGPAMPAPLCAPATPCEMTGSVTQRPRGLFPLCGLSELSD